jgi:glycosyltransferase involved in cell wall biosynthesis
MKILVMTPYAPYPPNSGGRIRILDELRFLSQRHEITLVSFYQLEHEYHVRAALDEFCERVFYFPRPERLLDSDKQSFQSIHDLFGWHTTPEMAAVLLALQSEAFDLVILHHIFMAQYKSFFDAPAVLVEHNIESNIFEQHARLVPAGEERAFRRARQILLRQYETAMWPDFGLRVVTSEHDGQEMARRCRTGHTLVVENGINTLEFAPVEPSPTRTVLFMGSLDFYPNIDALLYLRQSILPRLWERDSKVTLVIAGRRPPRLVQELALEPRIQVIADPPEMRPIVAQAAMTVAPMRIGSGSRIKILQSLAYGLPVVTTARGCEGLHVKDEHEVLIRDTPDEFAQAILRVLDEPQLAHELRQRGRALVETRYESAKILAGYEMALNEYTGR